MRWILFLSASICLHLCAADREVLFSRDIAPILEAKCISCHSAEKAKGGYRVHTFAALSQPGKSKKPAIVPHDPAESELFKRITASNQDDRMPQKEEPLSPGQIELFKAWIEADAKLDRGEPTALLATLLPARSHAPPPEVYRRPLPIIALAFSPDDKIAASGYREVTLWSREGELLRRITNVTHRVRSIAFSPDGKWLTIAGGQPGRGGELSLYDYASGELQTNLLRSSDELICVTFSADGKKLACAGTDNAIHLFEMDRLRPTITIQQHADWVTAISFNTNGTQIASASRDRTARIYDAATGNLETTYIVQNSPLYAVTFLADGNVASGGRDKTLHIWDGREGKKKSQIDGISGEINALLATSKFLFTASADGIVKQHAFSGYKLRHTFSTPGSAVYSLAYNSATQTLASGNYDGTISLWNIETGALEKAFVAAPGSTSNH